MAKKSYVFDGSAWVDLASSNTDLSSYSTTSQMNTAIAAKKGMTLLSTTTLSGASTTISGIDQTYADLEIWVYGVTNATGNNNIEVRPNAATTLVDASGTTNTAGSGALRARNNTSITSIDNFLRTDANNVGKIRIENYASTTNYKTVSWNFGYNNVTSQSVIDQLVGSIRTNSAITSLVFLNAGGNWSTGTVQIWGI